MRGLWFGATVLGLLGIAVLLGFLRTQPSDVSAANRGPLRVLATTTLAADLVRQVGGERVEVVTLMGPGLDPHQYRAREGDLRRLLEARLVVHHGLHLEGRMGHVLEALPDLGLPVLSLGDALPRDRLIGPPEAPDPHVWMDVRLWAEMVPAVARTLGDLDPHGSAEYQRRARDLILRLRDLDAWVRREIESLPPSRRLLVTAHDAFAYFGRAYGMEVRGVQGLSTVTEAGARDIARLAEEVVRRGVPALFVETSLSPRLVEAVLRAAEARGHRVVLGGTLFSDSLGDPETPEGTYEGMIRANVRTLVGGLGKDPVPLQSEKENPSSRKTETQASTASGQ